MMISKNLIHILKSNEMNQRELAELLFVSESQLSRIVKGNASPSIDLLKKIKDEFDICIDDFIYKDLSDEGNLLSVQETLVFYYLDDRVVKAGIVVYNGTKAYSINGYSKESISKYFEIVKSMTKRGCYKSAAEYIMEFQNSCEGTVANDISGTTYSFENHSIFKKGNSKTLAILSNISNNPFTPDIRVAGISDMPLPNAVNDDLLVKILSSESIAKSGLDSMAISFASQEAWYKLMLQNTNNKGGSR